MIKNLDILFPEFGLPASLEGGAHSDFFMFAAECKNKNVYLASPYSSQRTYQPDSGVSSAVMEERGRLTAKITEWLLRRGIWAFSPIVYGEAIKDRDHNLGAHDKGFWMKVDFHLFKGFDVLAVLALPGWRKSPGVDDEVGWALTMNKPVFILKPDDEWYR